MTNEQRVAKLAADMAQIDTISKVHGDKLIAELESANNEALSLIVKHRVKFCDIIARVLLTQRGVQV